MYPNCGVDGVRYASLSKIQTPWRRHLRPGAPPQVAKFDKLQDGDTGRAKEAGSSEVAELLHVVITSGLGAKKSDDIL
jgi:hypothetical protein